MTGKQYLEMKEQLYELVLKFIELAKTSETENKKELVEAIILLQDFV